MTRPRISLSHSMATAMARAIESVSALIRIERRLPGAYDPDGRWRDAGVEELRIRGSLQNMTDLELKNMDEGRRLRGGVKVYTRTRLYAGSVQEATQPDIILHAGARYEVQTVDDWSEAAGYYKATAIRIDQ